MIECKNGNALAHIGIRAKTSTNKVVGNFTFSKIIYRLISVASIEFF